MKLHEYQAKELLKSFGVPTPDGRVAEKADDAPGIVDELGGDVFVVKAQIHAGGRGKVGGVKVVRSKEAVREAAKAIIGMKLVSKQTGAEGKIVSKVLIEKGVDIARELYLGLLIDREKARIVVIASSEGGMEIEEVAKKNPEKIIKEHSDPVAGLMPYQLKRMGFALGLNSAEVGKFAKIALCCYRALLERDLSLVEINPLVVTKAGDVIALDAKISVDDNGLVRQKKLAEMRDFSEEDPREVEAGKYDLSYIGLDGTIGCLVNGAGLAMATMDIIKHYGATPANFLDVGGSATVEAVTAGFKIILSDHRVKAILVNIFGGIMRCDVVAESVVAAAKEVGIKVPLIVRLKGTNCEMGRDILTKSGLKIIPADTMDEAARMAVESLK